MLKKKDIKKTLEILCSEFFKMYRKTFFLPATPKRKSILIHSKEKKNNVIIIEKESKNVTVG